MHSRLSIFRSLPFLYTTFSVWSGRLQLRKLQEDQPHPTTGYGYFAEDTIGYGHPELKSVTANVESTSFFASLGETREERAKAFDRMAHEKIAYKRQLFRALQMVLRDIRAYEYDSENNKWRLYNRKKRRARPNDDC